LEKHNRSNDLDSQDKLGKLVGVKARTWKKSERLKNYRLVKQGTRSISERKKKKKEGREGKKKKVSHRKTGKHKKNRQNS